MIHSAQLSTFSFPSSSISPTKKLHFQFKTSNYTKNTTNKSTKQRQTVQNSKQLEPLISQSSGLCKCGCGRRHFMETIASTLLPSLPSLAFESESLHNSSPKEMLTKIHPPRPDWYEEFYASVLNNGMKSYEAEVTSLSCSVIWGEKPRMFWRLALGRALTSNIMPAILACVCLALIRTKRWRSMPGELQRLQVFHQKTSSLYMQLGRLCRWIMTPLMLSLEHSCLCSVKDVDETLREVKRVLRPGGLYLFVEHVAAKEGTSLRFAQNILDPLQQLLADGCHLTRETGKYIVEAGFSGVDNSITVISNATFINPHVYGIAHK